MEDHEMVNGRLRFFSQVFLNVVLDDAVEEKAGGEKVRLGMVVRVFYLPAFQRDATIVEGRGADSHALQVIRGNSVVMLEVSIIHIPSKPPFADHTAL